MLLMTLTSHYTHSQHIIKSHPQFCILVLLANWEISAIECSGSFFSRFWSWIYMHYKTHQLWWGSRPCSSACNKTNKTLGLRKKKYCLISVCIKTLIELHTTLNVWLLWQFGEILCYSYNSAPQCTFEFWILERSDAQRYSTKMSFVYLSSLVVKSPGLISSPPSDRKPLI